MKFFSNLNVLVALCSGMIGGIATGLTWTVSTLLELTIGRMPLYALISATIFINSCIVGLFMFWVGSRHGLQSIEDSGDDAESPTA